MGVGGGGAATAGFDYAADDYCGGWGVVLVDGYRRGEKRVGMVRVGRC